MIVSELPVSEYEQHDIQHVDIQHHASFGGPKEGSIMSRHSGDHAAQEIFLSRDNDRHRIQGYLHKYDQYSTHKHCTRITTGGESTEADLLVYAGIRYPI